MYISFSFEGDYISRIMSVDVFGRRWSSRHNQGVGRQGPSGNGFKRTHDGNYDMDSKKLCYLAEAEEELDAISMKILKKYIELNSRTLRGEIEALKTSVETSLQALQFQTSELIE